MNEHIQQPNHASTKQYMAANEIIKVVDSLGIERWVPDRYDEAVPRTSVFVDASEEIDEMPLMAIAEKHGVMIEIEELDEPLMYRTIHVSWGEYTGLIHYARSG